MNIAEKDDLLAAEYVLGLLDEHTRLQLDQRAAIDADFANQITRWQMAFSGIDSATESVIPAESVWAGIELELSQNQPVRTQPPSRSTASWLGWAIAAALASVLVFTYVNKPPEATPMQPIAVLSGAQPGEQFVVSASKSASLIQVSALNVTLPQNKSLQLWLIKGSAPPRSLGLITDRQRNDFKLDKKEDLGVQTIFAISLEPVGGSKLAGPSGPVVFQGKISPLS